MSRIVTFSRYFPGYHLLKGKPTYFVEKILNQLMPGWSNDDSYCRLLIELNQKKINAGKLTVQQIIDFWRTLDTRQHGIKLHTIRAGHSKKQGQFLTPAVWSGRPYHDPQIIFAPDIDVKKTWDFTVKKYVDVWYTDFGNYSIPDNVPLKCSMLQTVARNDGLSIDDFLDWFKFPQQFQGQIIAWDENVNY